MSDGFDPPVPALLCGLALAVGDTCIAQINNAGPGASNNSSVFPYSGMDSELGEHLFRDEKPIAEQLSVVIEKAIRKQYSPGSARRDAHPKAHDCVRAEFRVLDALPDRLAKGTFIPGKTYQAWIRFSNDSADPTRADIKRDARGMAIKVLGVPGKTLSAAVDALPKKPRHDFLRDALRASLQSGDACMLSTIILVE